MSRILIPSALLTLLVTLIALPYEAETLAVEPLGADCEARADRVVAGLERDAPEPLSAKERALARQAALATCDGGPAESAGTEAAAPSAEPQALAEPSEPEGSGFDRLVAALFSMEPRPAKTRPGGKYRYLEKD